MIACGPIVATTHQCCTQRPRPQGHQTVQLVAADVYRGRPEAGKVASSGANGEETAVKRQDGTRPPGARGPNVEPSAWTITSPLATLAYGVPAESPRGLGHEMGCPCARRPPPRGSLCRPVRFAGPGAACRRWHVARGGRSAISRAEGAAGAVGSFAEDHRSEHALRAHARGPAGTHSGPTREQLAGSERRSPSRAEPPARAVLELGDVPAAAYQ